MLGDGTMQGRGRESYLEALPHLGELLGLDRSGLLVRLALPVFACFSRYQLLLTLEIVHMARV